MLLKHPITDCLAAGSMILEHETASRCVVRKDTNMQDPREQAEALALVRAVLAAIQRVGPCPVWSSHA